MAIVIVLFSSFFALCVSVAAVVLGLAVVPAFAIYLTLGIVAPLYFVSRRNAQHRRTLATRFSREGII